MQAVLFLFPGPFCGPQNVNPPPPSLLPLKKFPPTWLTYSHVARWVLFSTLLSTWAILPTLPVNWFSFEKRLDVRSREYVWCDQSCETESLTESLGFEVFFAFGTCLTNVWDQQFDIGVNYFSIPYLKLSVVLMVCHLHWEQDLTLCKEVQGHHNLWIPCCFQMHWGETEWAPHSVTALRTCVFMFCFACLWPLTVNFK